MDLESENLKGLLIQALSLITGVTLLKSHNFWGLQFPHL